MTLKKHFVQILPLAIIVGGLLAYNFMNAQWTGPPPVTAPGNNVKPPINIGTSTASKQSAKGDLIFNRFAAQDAVWSPLYCNALGGNCILQEDLNTFAAYSATRANRQSGIMNGQKVSVRCLDVGNASGKAIDYEIMTGGGCRVISAYDELATDEGDVFSYPESDMFGKMFWSCENKNLASSTIEATAVCLFIHTATAALPTGS